MYELCGILIFDAIGFLGGNQVGYSLRLQIDKRSSEYSYPRFLLSLGSVLLLAFVYGRLIIPNTSDDLVILIMEIALMISLGWIGGRRSYRYPSSQYSRNQ